MVVSQLGQDPVDDLDRELIESRATEVARGSFALPSGTVCCRAIAAIAIAQCAGMRFSRQGSRAPAALPELAAAAAGAGVVVAEAGPSPARGGPAEPARADARSDTSDKIWQRPRSISGAVRARACRNAPLS